MCVFLDAFFYRLAHESMCSDKWYQDIHSSTTGWPEFGQFLGALWTDRNTAGDPVGNPVSPRQSMCVLAASLGLVEVLRYVADTDAHGGKYVLDEATLLAAAATENVRGSACFRFVAETTADVWSREACLKAARSNPSISGEECVAFLSR